MSKSLKIVYAFPYPSMDGFIAVTEPVPHFLYIGFRIQFKSGMSCLYIQCNIQERVMNSPLH